eukprot:Nitzschia sp. Nitz4//scaffold99_size76975//30427//31383//NITZ4_005574-RA/size76975-processed-gene-0.45-mRNA-1//-1//CDS//3329560844//9111//frame0
MPMSMKETATRQRRPSREDMGCVLPSECQPIPGPEVDDEETVVTSNVQVRHRHFESMSKLDSVPASPTFSKKEIHHVPSSPKWSSSRGRPSVPASPTFSKQRFASAERNMAKFRPRPAGVDKQPRRYSTGTVEKNAEKPSPTGKNVHHYDLVINQQPSADELLSADSPQGVASEKRPVPKQHQVMLPPFSPRKPTQAKGIPQKAKSAPRINTTNVVRRPPVSPHRTKNQSMPNLDLDPNLVQRFASTRQKAKSSPTPRPAQRCSDIVLPIQEMDIESDSAHDVIIPPFSPQRMDKPQAGKGQSMRSVALPPLSPNKMM